MRIIHWVILLTSCGWMLFSCLVFLLRIESRREGICGYNEMLDRWLVWFYFLDFVEESLVSESRVEAEIDFIFCSILIELLRIFTYILIF